MCNLRNYHYLQLFIGMYLYFIWKHSFQFALLLELCRFFHPVPPPHRDVDDQENKGMN